MTRFDEEFFSDTSLITLVFLRSNTIHAVYVKSGDSLVGERLLLNREVGGSNNHGDFKY